MKKLIWRGATSAGRHRTKFTRYGALTPGNCRKRENQQDATIICLLLTSISTYFGHHYAHLQENKEPIIAYGVLFWFCWMWLVAVVGRCLAGCEHYEGFCSTGT